MHNNLPTIVPEPITILNPEIEEPQTPEKTKEQPAPMPNPFTIPTPHIQPGTAPSPKA